MAALTNHQLNQLKDEIERVGLKYSDFNKTEKDTVLRLTYKTSPLYFETSAVDQFLNFKYRRSTFSPNFASTGSSYSTSFGSILEAFRGWLTTSIVRYAHDSKFNDPWAEVQNNFSNATLNDRDSDTFSTEEVKLITTKLDTIPGVVKNLALPDATKDEIIAEIRQLREEVKKTSKKEWIKKFLGTFTLLSIRELASNDSARTTLIEFAKSVFESFGTIGQYLPPEGIL